MQSQAYIAIHFNKAKNKEGPKVGDHIRISKYKHIFGKSYAPNWYEEFFGIRKVKKTVPWKKFIDDLNIEEIVGTFYEKKFQKTNQKVFRVEKVTKRKDDIHYKLNGKATIVLLILGFIKKM